MTDPGSSDPPAAIDWQPWIDLLECGLVVWDREDRLVACNRDFRNLYGPVADRIVPGMRFETLLRAVIAAGLVPQSQGNEEAWLRQRLDEHRSPRGGTFLRQMGNGRWRRITETRLPGGGVLAFSIDVTEMIEQGHARDRALEEARLARQRLDDAVQALPVGFELWDSDDRLVAFNAELARLYPQIAAELHIGAEFGELVRANHRAGGLALPASELDDYIERRRRERRRASAGGAEHGSRGGRWLRIFDHPARDGGVVGVRIEVTELHQQREAARQAQAQAEAASQTLADAIEALPDGFALYDANDRLVVCNQRYREIYRESAPAMVLGATFEDILRYGLRQGQYPQAAGQEESWLTERLHRHRHPGPPEIQQIPGNRWLRIDERTTRDGGIAGVRTEVTELVRREQQLEELNAQLQAARARLEALSETDPLTGLANRRLFDRRLTEEWSRLARHGMRLSLLMVDIDHFKLYNDRHGHLEGDACLRRVASALASCGARPTDVVARLGGEEFALLLPHTDRDAAAVMAMRCVEAVDAAEIPHGASPAGPHVTISVGGACFAQRPPGDPQQLIRAADEALYRAKAAGRHRTEFAAATPTFP